MTPPHQQRVLGMLARFFRHVGGWQNYIVRGWYLDSNGCLKTYGEGYAESFSDETQYLPNSTLELQSHYNT